MTGVRCGHGAAHHRRRLLWATIATLAALVLLPTAAQAAVPVNGGPWLWQHQNVFPDYFSPASVTFAGPSRGWVVGQDGTILATTDSGATWDSQLAGTGDNSLSQVAFADAMHGWALGRDGDTGNPLIFATTNGGVAWSTQYSGTADLSFGAFTFADASHGWAVGYNHNTGENVILATTDAGATWNTQTATADYGLNAVAFADATHGCAVGNDYNSGTSAVLTTTDGGATWTPQDVGPTNSGLSAVTFASATHGWAVGTTYDNSTGNPNGGVVLATTDAGVTWNAQSPATAAGLSAVSFATATHGWTVGTTYDSNDNANGNAILATTDGGATWNAQTSGTTSQLNIIAAADATHAWAATADGGMLSTTDGGATWTLSPNDEFLAITMADASHAWAVGMASQPDGEIIGRAIYATTDGGADWNAQYQDATDHFLNAAANAGQSHAWAVGTSGTILATTDGGTTWKVIGQPPVSAWNFWKASTIRWRAAPSSAPVGPGTVVLLPPPVQPRKSAARRLTARKRRPCDVVPLIDRLVPKVRLNP